MTRSAMNGNPGDGDAVARPQPEGVDPFFDVAPPEENLLGGGLRAAAPAPTSAEVAAAPASAAAPAASAAPAESAATPEGDIDPFFGFAWGATQGIDAREREEVRARAALQATQAAAALLDPEDAAALAEQAAEAVAAGRIGQDFPGRPHIGKRVQPSPAERFQVRQRIKASSATLRGGSIATGTASLL